MLIDDGPENRCMLQNIFNQSFKLQIFHVDIVSMMKVLVCALFILAFCIY